jgi:hypothetical protein
MALNPTPMSGRFATSSEAARTAELTAAIRKATVILDGYAPIRDQAVMDRALVDARAVLPKEIQITTECQPNGWWTFGFLHSG